MINSVGGDDHVPCLPTLRQHFRLCLLCLVLNYVPEQERIETIHGKTMSFQPTLSVCREKITVFAAPAPSLLPLVRRRWRMRAYATTPYKYLVCMYVHTYSVQTYVVTEYVHTITNALRSRGISPIQVQSQKYLASHRPNTSGVELSLLPSVDLLSAHLGRATDGCSLADLRLPDLLAVGPLEPLVAARRSKHDGGTTTIGCA